MAGKQKYIWLLVTRDRYELPLVVANSAGELARLVGVKKSTIERAEFNRSHYGHRSKYVKVPL